MVHPQTRRLLKEGEYPFPVPEPVQHHRQCADVHAVGGQRHQVARYPVEFGHQEADCHRPGRKIDAQQLLDRKRVGQLVVEGRQVVHPRDVGRTLKPVELLACFLHPSVEVADDRLGAANDLTFEFDVEPEDSMRRRVLRAHVEDHQLVVGRQLILEQSIIPEGASFLFQAARIRFRHCHLLSAFVGGFDQPFGLLGSRQPDIYFASVLRIAHHFTWCESLNWTGTEPTP